jgi:hypothetical protein
MEQVKIRNKRQASVGKILKDRYLCLKIKQVLDLHVLVTNKKKHTPVLF